MKYHGIIRVGIDLPPQVGAYVLDYSRRLIRYRLMIAGMVTPIAYLGMEPRGIRVDYASPTIKSWEGHLFVDSWVEQAARALLAAWMMAR